MNTKIAIFAVIALAAVFALANPIEYVIADSTNSSSDGEYKSGNHTGKSCPNKEKKTASITDSNI